MELKVNLTKTKMMVSGLIGKYSRAKSIHEPSAASR